MMTSEFTERELIYHVGLAMMTLPPDYLTIELRAIETVHSRRHRSRIPPVSAGVVTPCPRLVTRRYTPQTADMRDCETIDPALRLIALVRRSGPLPLPGRAGMSIPASMRAAQPRTSIPWDL